MPTNSRIFSCFFIALLSCALAFGQNSGKGNGNGKGNGDANRQGPKNRIERPTSPGQGRIVAGSYLVRLVPDDVEPTDQPPGPFLPGLLQIHFDGTVSATEGVADETTAMGAWIRTGPRAIRAKLFGLGTEAGNEYVYRVRMQLEFDQHFMEGKGRYLYEMLDPDASSLEPEAEVIMSIPARVRLHRIVVHKPDMEPDPEDD